MRPGSKWAGSVTSMAIHGRVQIGFGGSAAGAKCQAANHWSYGKYCTPSAGCR